MKKKIIFLGDGPTDQIKEHIHAIAVTKHQEYIQKQIIEKGKVTTIFHEIVLHDIIKGLFEEHHERGLLVRFLDYVFESGTLEHFEKSEERFMLDSEFNITTDKEKAMVKLKEVKMKAEDTAENGLLFDDDYARGLKEKIRSIKHSIESGSFAMSPSEDNCAYCPYVRICHKSLFSQKGKNEPLTGDDNV